MTITERVRTHPFPSAFTRENTEAQMKSFDYQRTHFPNPFETAIPGRPSVPSPHGKGPAKHHPVHKIHVHKTAHGHPGPPHGHLTTEQKVRHILDTSRKLGISNPQSQNFTEPDVLTAVKVMEFITNGAHAIGDWLYLIIHGLGEMVTAISDALVHAAQNCMRMIQQSSSDYDEWCRRNGAVFILGMWTLICIIAAILTP